MLPMYDLSGVPPKNLAQLFNLINSTATNSATAWHEGDYGAILDHLLDAPLLLLSRESLDGDVDCVPLSGECAVGSLRDSLLSHAPDPAVLELIKGYAKREYHAADRAIPKTVALVLYYVTICRALGKARISELNDKDLREGVRWSLSQTWVAAPARDILDQAQRQLSDST